MTKFDFTLQGQDFVLDLKNGELLGDDSSAKQKIIDAVNAGNEKGGYGSGYSPVPPTNITAPYHNLGEFALCMSELGLDFPEDFRQFIPVWNEVDEFIPFSQTEKDKFGIDDLLILH